MDGVSFGNVESERHHGWLVGHFIDEDPVRRTDKTEVKWGNHKEKTDNGKWAANKTAFTISIVLDVEFRIRFWLNGRIEEQLLRKGQYVAWGPGIYHDWKAETDCIILTVRWPSADKDQIVVDYDKIK